MNLRLFAFFYYVRLCCVTKKLCTELCTTRRIYGIKNGRPEKVAHNEPVVTQDDLAEQLDVSKAQLKRYKSLTDLIPELQDAVQSKWT